MAQSERVRNVDDYSIYCEGDIELSLGKKIVDLITSEA